MTNEGDAPFTGTRRGLRAVRRRHPAVALQAGRAASSTWPPSSRSSMCRSTAASAATSAAISTSTARATCSSRPATTRTRSSRTATRRSTTARAATRPSTRDAGGQHERPPRQAPAHPRQAPAAATPSRSGNLFRPGTAQTRPEIYAMGLRNPFRFAVNRNNDDVYLGDYSPDAPVANPDRGPAGQGRWMIIRRPGNYGWPFCATPDMPYVDYDFESASTRARIQLQRADQRLAAQHRPAARCRRRPARRLVHVHRCPRCSRNSADAAADRADGRAGVRLRRGRTAQCSAGRRTTTACRFSTSGPATTSRSSGSTAPTATG